MKQVRLSEDERKRSIVEAAAQVAQEQGLDKMTARAVARTVGISHGLILHHFGSMDDVQSALLDWLLVRVLEPQTAELDDVPPEKRLLAFLERQLAWLDHEPGLMEVVFDYWSRGTRDPDVRQRISRRMQSFREAVEPIAADLVATNPARFRQTSPRALAVTTGDLVLGYAIQRQIHPDAGDRDSVLAAIRSLLETGDAT
ncbi:MAG TPA: TetR/AcrR family transcriptional regulator [Thermomicrobiales bacterium]|nr:TetR/AcrR family transcriptional regulator [Thermomicrobiales bacterium]